MNGYRKPLFVLSCAGLFCCSFISMEEKQYLDHVLKSYSAELFRNQRFTLLKAKATYGWKNLNRVELSYSCYRFLDVPQARQLIMEIAHQVLQRINEDPLLDQQGFFSGGHFCVANLRIEIRVDNYISRSTDASEGVKTILLDGGTITYTTFTSSPYMSTGAHVVKEAYSDVLFLVPGEPNAAREMEQNLQKTLLQNAELGAAEVPVTAVEVKIMPVEKEALLLKTDVLTQPAEILEPVIENIETVNRLHMAESTQHIEQYVLPIQPEAGLKSESQQQQNQSVESQVQAPSGSSTSKEPNLDAIFESRQFQEDSTSAYPEITEPKPSTSSSNKSVLPKTLVPISPQEPENAPTVPEKPVSLNEEMKNSLHVTDAVASNDTSASNKEETVSSALLDNVISPEVDSASLSIGSEQQTMQAEDVQPVSIEASVPNNKGGIPDYTSPEATISEEIHASGEDAGKENEAVYEEESGLSYSIQNEVTHEDVSRGVNLVDVADSNELQDTESVSGEEQKKTSLVQKFFRFFSSEKKSDPSAAHETGEDEEKPSFFERLFGKKTISAKIDDDISRDEAQKKKEILLKRLLYDEGTFEQSVAQDDSALDFEEDHREVSLQEKKPSFFEAVFGKKTENTSPEIVEESVQKSERQSDIESPSFLQSFFGSLKKNEIPQPKEPVDFVAASEEQDEHIDQESQTPKRSIFSRIFGNQKGQQAFEERTAKSSESKDVFEEISSVNTDNGEKQGAEGVSEEQYVDQSGKSAQRSIFSRIFGDQKGQQDSEEKMRQPIAEVNEPLAEEQVYSEDVIQVDDAEDAEESDRESEENGIVQNDEQDSPPAQRSIFSRIFGDQKGQQDSEEKMRQPIAEVNEPLAEEQVYSEDVVQVDDAEDAEESDRESEENGIVQNDEQDSPAAQRSIFSRIFGDQKGQQDSEEKMRQPIAEVNEPLAEEQVYSEDVVQVDDAEDAEESDRESEENGIVQNDEQDSPAAQRSIFSRIFGDQKGQQDSEEKMRQPIAEVNEPLAEEQVYSEDVIQVDDAEDAEESDRESEENGIVQNDEQDSPAAQRSIFSRIFGDQKGQQDSEEKMRQPIAEVNEPLAEEQVYSEDVIQVDDAEDAEESDRESEENGIVQNDEQDSQAAQRSIFSRIFGDQKSESEDTISINSLEEDEQQAFQTQSENSSDKSAKQKQFLRKIFGSEKESAQAKPYISSSEQTQEDLDTFEFDGDITEEEAADLKKRLLERIEAKKESKAEQASGNSQSDQNKDMDRESSANQPTAYANPGADNSKGSGSFFHMLSPERREFELADEYEDDNGEPEDDAEPNNRDEEYLGFNQNSL